MGEFVAEGIKYRWEDCAMGFECPRCGKILIGDSQNGWTECDCGLEYCLSARLLFRRKKDGEE